VDPSCNLSWRTFRVRPLAVTILLFPALDCFTIFPMNTIFISNNVMAVLRPHQWRNGSLPRLTRHLCRVAMLVMPFACALVSPSLSRAIQFSGIIGIFLPYIMTPYLHRASLRRCEAHWGRDAFAQAEARAGFRTLWSSEPRVTAFGAVGVLLLTCCVVSTALPQSTPD
jgi:hypothetical protein